MHPARRVFILFLIVVVLSAACSGGQYLTVQNLQAGQSVKLILKNGRSVSAFIAGNEGDKIVYVSGEDHKPYKISQNEIRRIERLKINYDEQAYPISAAEIERVKTNRNTWGFAIGGAVIGGAVGLVIGLPLWYADVNAVPPYFVAGAGAVMGSIYFAFRGQDKDRSVAVEKIRYQRMAERKLEDEIAKEKDRLKKIEEEKKELKKKLEKKEKK